MIPNYKSIEVHMASTQNVAAKRYATLRYQ